MDSELKEQYQLANTLRRDLADAVRYLRRRIMANDIELGEFDQLVVMVCSFAGLFKEREIKDKQ